MWATSQLFHGLKCLFPGGAESAGIPRQEQASPSLCAGERGVNCSAPMCDGRNWRETHERRDWAESFYFSKLFYKKYLVKYTVKLSQNSAGLGLGPFFPPFFYFFNPVIFIAKRFNQNP